VRYLALGDSYSIGEGIAASARWPVQLAQRLRAEGLPLDDPRIIARTGWTTDELAAAIDAETPPSDFDLVSLLIGVNNQYRGRGVEEFRAQCGELLQRAVAFAAGRPRRVFALAIPDWSVTAFGAGSGRDCAQVAREMDACNAAAAALCAGRGIAFVDIAPISRRCGGWSEMQAGDRLHPSAGLHALWTSLALPVARRPLA
jgi:hypothetical protein